jgi:hypothetical protein
MLFGCAAAITLLKCFAKLKPSNPLPVHYPTLKTTFAAVHYFRGITSQNIIDLPP